MQQECAKSSSSSPPHCKFIKSWFHRANRAYNNVLARAGEKIAKSMLLSFFLFVSYHLPTFVPEFSAVSRKEAMKLINKLSINN